VNMSRIIAGLGWLVAIVLAIGLMAQGDLF
jgi:hypothetical protein